MAQSQTRIRRLYYFNLPNNNILLADKFSNRIPGFEHLTQETFFFSLGTTKRLIQAGGYKIKKMCVLVWRGTK